MAVTAFEGDAVLNRLLDAVVTLVCWIYFIFAFLFFFSFFYGAARLFAKDRETAFQYLNHRFFRGFFVLLRFLSPNQKWRIDADVGKISGSVIVCNHLSYLDPLLLISLLPQQKTIVKSIFFRAPVFGWILKVSGYLPASSSGRNGERMIGQLEKMGDYLQKGGNLFVFPEGTRSRDGSLGSLHGGVFKIVRMYRCPVRILRISGTEKLFTPGEFFFHTKRENTIELSILDCILPDTKHCVSAAALEKDVRRILEHTRQGGNPAG